MLAHKMRSFRPLFRSFSTSLSSWATLDPKTLSSTNVGLGYNLGNAFKELMNRT